MMQSKKYSTRIANKLLGLIILTFAICISSFSLAAGPETEDSTSGFGLTDPVDDRAIKNMISSKSDALLMDDKIVQIKKISEQLNRKQTELRLPRLKTTELTSREIYQQVTPSVLILSKIYKCGRCERWHDRSAGAFVLTADGAIVTNYHVVEGPRDDERAMVATTSTGDVYPVKELLAASETDDVVILQLALPRGVQLQPAKVAQRSWPGEDAIVISHPVGRFYSLTKGTVSRNATLRMKAGASNRMFITADYAKGSSGSPVFNSLGEVIGLVSSTESIYYTQTNDVQKNLQMVFHNCVQGQAVLSLIK
ncbi:MAG: trypsin-like peptidase domain-containing protein [Planctomycetaceae bacterium]|jgi:S1-C subfamily serine protease|nr:trypsin-like peptidase domain-containing protein [Planctomycetaceae bacterium]MBT4725166.1 trypsin-like peptidase domain-containing protein [Planctomycetaceae bacterium]MBT4844385.1 trypsin-like peptidase domain-containing protein [Planctomycetaceae bacterium]MBT5125772.1 trypsin-like peptidase domain-containing protein [Planctomycetaceae bacterium]MBT5598292.1 trypsin-like peptidase domain-containing protein [Planctomycetaceae bacterium]